MLFLGTARCFYNIFVYPCVSPAHIVSFLQWLESAGGSACLHRSVSPATSPPLSLSVPARLHFHAVKAKGSATQVETFLISRLGCFPTAKGQSFALE